MTEAAIADAVRLVAEVLDLGVERIGAETSMLNEPAWDSLAHMRLIMAIESRLGRELSPEILVEIMTISDVARALKA